MQTQTMVTVRLPSYTCQRSETFTQVFNITEGLTRFLEIKVLRFDPYDKQSDMSLAL